jgi:uncharacterized protein (TIGR00661 family)
LLDNINIQRVLVAPLDWGLGHATRCIPIIHALLLQKHEVILAADAAVATLLHTEFPTLEILPLKGYHIQYAKTSAGFPFQIVKQIPGILKTIQEENTWLDKIIQEKNIQLVISDNRYGLYSKKIPTVFITHQLNIITPFRFLDRIIQKVHYRFINRFTVCWVPDSEGLNNLGGVLSHPVTLPAIPVNYIGLLSRCKKTILPIQFQYCFMLSGPEPQRSILEEKIVQQISQLDSPIVIIRGLPNATNILAVPSNVTVYQHLLSEQLANTIAASEWVICRSGYTSLMELTAMQKKKILIPTPGQTEQEYLAKKLQQQNMGYQLIQSNLNLCKDLDAATKTNQQFPEIPFFNTNTLQQLLLNIQTM